MIKESIKFQNSTIFEGMTSIRAIIKGRELGINDRHIERIIYDKNKLNKIAKEISYIKAVSSKFNYEVVKSSTEEIENLSIGNTHGGILAIASSRTIPPLSASSDIKDKGFYCMIQGIEDPYNFGYSLRSLYATGCDGIILPERNWMSAAGVVARSSAGTSELFPIFTSNPITAPDIFHDKGYTVVCADERTDNLLGKCELNLPILLIIGGEKRGISKELLLKTDKLVKIQYGRDFRASLSAASATAMFAYEIMRQNLTE